MKSRITHFSLIIDFLDIDFNANKLGDHYKAIVDQVLLNKGFATKNDWLVEFKAVYNNGRHLLISRNKLGTLYSDKTKEINIIIPIPSIQVVSWGVEDKQYIYSPDHYDSILRNFWLEEVDFRQFSNRSDYINDCIRRAIEKAFFEGFTVGGVKVSDKALSV